MKGPAPAQGTPLRILVFILALGAGGAERLASTAANHWAGLGHKVTVVTYAGPESPPFYDLHPAVRWHPLGLVADSPGPWAALRNNARRWRAVRRAIRDLRPHVLVSYMDRENVMAVLASRGLRLPVLGYVVSDPAHTRIGPAWSLLRRATYPWLDRLVVQTERAKAWFPPRVQARCLLLPNPVSPPPGDGGTGPALPRPCLVTVGRLVAVKNHALLLRAFARVAGIHPDWSLVLVGEGELRGRLETQARDLGIGHRVLLTGVLKDPYHALRQAEAFVLASDREGFPMALCEAMSCGLPAVATDCPSGPREIIRDGVDGLLVPPGDEAALAAALGTVMADPALRRRMGARAREVQERFSAERVLDRLTRDVEGLAAAPR